MELSRRANVICATILTLLPLATWKYLYNLYNQLKQDHESKLLKYQRHNCVVFFRPDQGHSGWPGFTDRVVPNIKDGIESLLSPFLYFILSAENTLDVAMMMISVDIIFDALVEVSKRGVKVRIFLNYEHIKGNEREIINNMVKSGMKVLLYVSAKENLTSIMHYKYIIKDYTENGGYVCMGSMNVTNSAFLQNYEDIVFSSNRSIVEAIHGNFNKCWHLVSLDNQKLYNKAVLHAANLSM